MSGAAATLDRRPRGRSPGARQAMLWGLCLAIVMAVHGAAWFWLRALTPPAMVAALPQPAVLLDLAPLPVAPPEQTVPPPEPPPPVQELTPPPEPPPLEPPPPEPEIVPPPPPPMPPPPLPDVVLPKPPPPMIRHPPPRPRPPVHHEQAPPAPVAAPPPPQAAPAPVRAAPNAGQVSARWEGAVAGYLARFKRYPVAAQRKGEEGVALMRFTVDRAGNVLSVAMVRSSGHADLDREAEDWVHRASPVPAPPPEAPGAQVALMVPLGFHLQ